MLLQMAPQTAYQMPSGVELEASNRTILFRFGTVRSDQD